MSDTHFLSYDNVEQILTPYANKINSKLAQHKVMPTASQILEDQVIQYIGTEGTYKFGHFYHCKNNNGTYTWEDLTSIIYGYYNVEDNQFYADENYLTQLDPKDNSIYISKDSWTTYTYDVNNEKYVEINNQPLVGTAKETVEAITYGWNLGNTMDATVTLTSSDPKALTRIDTDEECPYYETCWGQPRPREELFDLLKTAGFNAVRIPITWAQHIYDDDEYTMSTKWVPRIKEIVQWCIDRDMYVIINTHHDDADYKEKVGQGYLVLTGWLDCDPETIDIVNKQFAKIWTNIANEFKDFDNHLIFESFNELMTHQRNWLPATLEEYRALNILNQTFVDVIRDTGGNNATRTLCCQTYMGSRINNEYLEPPVDTIENGIIWQVHDYSSNFDQYLDLTPYEFFTSKNMPFIIGEFGTRSTMDQDLRRKHIQNFVARFKEIGGKCFWWDDGGSFQLMDRTNLNWFDPTMITNLQKGNQGIVVTTDYIIDEQLNGASNYLFKSLGETSANKGEIVNYITNRGSFVNKTPIDISNAEYFTVSISAKDAGGGMNLRSVAIYDENGVCQKIVAPIGSPTYTIKTEGCATARFCFYNPYGWRSLQNIDEYFKNGDLTVTIRTF